MLFRIWRCMKPLYGKMVSLSIAASWLQYWKPRAADHRSHKSMPFSACQYVIINDYQINFMFVCTRLPGWRAGNEGTPTQNSRRAIILKHHQDVRSRCFNSLCNNLNWFPAFKPDN